MGRKTKSLELHFDFVRTSNPLSAKPSTRIQQSYSLDGEETDGYDGLTYEDVNYYLQDFIKSHKLPSEVRLAYISPLDDQMMEEINADFCLSYQSIREIYDGTFVVLVQTRIENFSQRLDRIIKKVDELFEEVEELRKN